MFSNFFFKNLSVDENYSAHLPSLHPPEWRHDVSFWLPHQAADDVSFWLPHQGAGMFEELAYCDVIRDHMGTSIQQVSFWLPHQGAEMFEELAYCDVIRDHMGSSIQHVSFWLPHQAADDVSFWLPHQMADDVSFWLPHQGAEMFDVLTYCDVIRDHMGSSIQQVHSSKEIIVSMWTCHHKRHALHFPHRSSNMDFPPYR